MDEGGRLDSSLHSFPMSLDINVVPTRNPYWTRQSSECNNSQNTEIPWSYVQFYNLNLPALALVFSLSPHASRRILLNTFPVGNFGFEKSGHTGISIENLPLVNDEDIPGLKHERNAKFTFCKRASPWGMPVVPLENMRYASWCPCRLVSHSS